MGLIKISKTALPDVINIYHALDTSVRYDEADFNNMYMTSFLQILINQGLKLMPTFCNRGWIEVDTVADLDLYHGQGSLNRALSIGCSV